MKWKKIYIVLLACMFLTGCQATQKKTDTNDITTNSQTPKDFKNGDHIEIPLTDEVQIDAQIQTASVDKNTCSQYRSAVIGFDGEEVLPKILGFMPEDGLNKSEGSSGTEYLYYYQGDLGNFKSNTQGVVIVGNQLTVQTDHWEKIGSNLPIFYNGNNVEIYDTGVDQSQEFSFASLEKAVSEIKQYIKDVIGLEEVEMIQAFAFNYEQMNSMQKMQQNLPEEETAKSIETIPDMTWGTEDNCYWILFEQIIHGVPVLSNQINRQDDLYIPSCQIIVGYTQDGIEYLQIDNGYQQLEEKEVSLRPIEDIVDTLKKKFELAITGEVTIDQMKLIYYPLTIGKNQHHQWECDMMPTWEFRLRQDEYSNYVYIDAVNGIEIVE